MARVMLAVVAVAALVGCGGPTLTEVQTQVFTRSCATAGCHKNTTATSTDAAEGLDLEKDTFAKLVGVASVQAPAKKLVVAGDPDNSYLIEKMEKMNPPSGTQMPPTGALPVADLELVRGWIASGAPNN